MYKWNRRRAAKPCAMSGDPNATFTEAVLALEEHFDDGVQFTMLKGGAVMYSGFHRVKCRRLDHQAKRCGKTIKYTMGTAISLIATPDTDMHDVQPTSLAMFTAATGCVPTYTSPQNRATRQHRFLATALSSARVRNLLSHPEVLDVWIEKDGFTIHTIQPSLTLGGLSERAASGKLHSRQPTLACRRPRFLSGKSRHSSRKSGRLQWALQSLPGRKTIAPLSTTSPSKPE